MPYWLHLVVCFFIGFISSLAFESFALGITFTIVVVVLWSILYETTLKHL